MSTEVNTYNDHDVWLTRQHALLGELADMTDLPRDPPPRVLPPLPWWQDWYRLNGEARRVLDALMFAAGAAAGAAVGVVRGMLKWRLRATAAGALAVYGAVLLVLFCFGFWLARL